MAASLRAQRVETRRLCEDRRQLLELTLIQLRDANRLQPKTIEFGELSTFEIDVKAVLEAEKSGGKWKEDGGRQLGNDFRGAGVM